MKPIFTPPTEQDLLDLAADIRPEDAAEIDAATGLPPYEAVRLSVSASDAAYAVRLDGRLIAIFGIYAESIIEETAIIWALGTRQVIPNWRTFARWSRPGLLSLADEMPWVTTLQNCVHAPHATAIRWLGWLGADFGEPFQTEHPLTRQPQTFIPFSLKRSALCP